MSDTQISASLNQIMARWRHLFDVRGATHTCPYTPQLLPFPPAPLSPHYLPRFIVSNQGLLPGPHGEWTAIALPLVCVEPCATTVCRLGELDTGPCSAAGEHD